MEDNDQIINYAIMKFPPTIRAAERKYQLLWLQQQSVCSDKERVDDIRLSSCNK